MSFYEPSGWCTVLCIVWFASVLVSCPFGCGSLASVCGNLMSTSSVEDCLLISFLVCCTMFLMVSHHFSTSILLWFQIPFYVMAAVNPLNLKSYLLMLFVKDKPASTHFENEINNEEHAKRNGYFGFDFFFLRSCFFRGVLHSSEVCSMFAMFAMSVLAGIIRFVVWTKCILIYITWWFWFSTIVLFVLRMPWSFLFTWSF